MPRLYVILGLCALAVFTQAQYRGIGLFDDIAAGQASRLGSSGRTSFHK